MLFFPVLSSPARSPMRLFEAAPEITAPTTDVSLCVPFGAVTAAMPPPAAPGLRAGSSSSGRRASFSGRPAALRASALRSGFSSV